MEDSKCYFVQLVTLYSQRILYGYKCDLDKLWRDITDFDRVVTLEENIQECHLRGAVIDEINKIKNKLTKTYELVCRTC
jgi:hypothetical protein